MPKMKTHSGAKKRLKITASGKIKAGQTGKQHLMRHCSKAQLRNLRGTEVLSDSDTKRIKKKFLPYGLK